MKQAAVLRVRARNLDTGKESCAELEVEPKHTPHAEHEQMISAVKDLYPDAKPRTFENGVGTFLGPKCLIIAAYSRQKGKRQAEERARQESLFVA